MHKYLKILSLERAKMIFNYIQYNQWGCEEYFVEFGNVGDEREELPESWLSGLCLLDFIWEPIEVFGLDKDPWINMII